MIRTRINNGIGLLTLFMLSACATDGAPERLADGAQHCPPPNTLTCDRFAGENYNCTCERGGNLREMLDAYDINQDLRL